MGEICVLEKVKKINNRIFLVAFGLFLLLFMFFTIFTIIYRSINGNFDSITWISIVAIVLSIPGIVKTFTEEYNPKKKTYKLSCHCPKCKHLIQMDMKEE